MFSRRPRRRQSRVSLLLKRFMQRLFRALFYFQGRRAGLAGFVFPSTILLILVVTLSAGALTYRSYTRSDQVILDRQQQVILNAATPAIDRAKAKLEYLLLEDDRPRPSIPPSKALENLLRAVDGNMIEGGAYQRLAIESIPDDQDIYTLEDEVRVDIGAPLGRNDNAWVYRADLDADGVASDNELVVYSISVEDLKGRGANDRATPVSYDSPDVLKARNLVVRNSSLIAEAASPCITAEGRDDQQRAITTINEEEEALSGAGWEAVNALTSEKTFQVNVLTIDLDRPAGAFVNTLEFQQVRQANLGNKWGAFFRYDLEVFPGAPFNWNGAMHTQGSLFAADSFNAYMISSRESCAYDEGLGSEITLGAKDADTGFQGQLVAGTNKTNDFEGGATIHRELNQDEEASPANIRAAELGQRDGTIGPRDGIDVRDIYLDPVRLHLQGEYAHIGDNVSGNDGTFAANFNNADNGVSPTRVRNANSGEISFESDDIFRADDRYGPVARYKETDNPEDRIPPLNNIGDNIDEGNDNLKDLEEGLDGFWERQAAIWGSRFLVGQRLELGNVNGWNYDPRTGVAANPAVIPAADGVDRLDPLYPPNDLPLGTTNGSNGRGESAQRKSLRDNLAAVQGMVVYHYQSGAGQEPLVCLATTAHHGNYQTIGDSRTFRRALADVSGNGAVGDEDIVTDFLRGKGTNGWQFAPVVGTDFANLPLGKQALDNLARFAGDAEGGAPSFSPRQAGSDPDATDAIHPFPYKTMWGDFSMLRRVELENEGNDSIADKSTVDTAACTLSLLAHNLRAVKAEYESYAAADWADLAQVLTDNAAAAAIAAGDPLWFPFAWPASLNTPGIVTDADTVDTPQPIEAWIREVQAGAGFADDAQRLQAEIAAEYWGIEYSRAFGFANRYGLPGPAVSALAGTYNAQTGTYTVSGGITAPYDAAPNTIYSVGCDPNIFTDAAYGLPAARQEADALSLALALCPSKLQQPPLPSLFYLFPTATHNLDPTTNVADLNVAPGTYAGGVNSVATNYPFVAGTPVIVLDDDADPTNSSTPDTFPFDTEAYVDEVATALGAAEGGLLFDSFTYDDIESIAATPLAPIDWVIDKQTIVGEAEPTQQPFDIEFDDANTPDDRPWDLVIENNDTTFATAIGAPLLDKVIYSGRENLAIRLLDMHLPSLFQGTNGAGDRWISSAEDARGVVYAFREDAVREDTIVRPKNTNLFANCETYDGGFYNLNTNQVNANCAMNTSEPDILNWLDPPMAEPAASENYLISLKPIDFTPDPMRRPYGFRLREGRNFNRPDEVQDGLSFITDNAVVIQGDFNLHNTPNAADSAEEFRTPLIFEIDPDGNGFFGEFYGRQDTDVNDQFTDPTQDSWRPAEIQGDAVYLFSDAVRDGHAEAVYDPQTYDALPAERLTFNNINRPEDNDLFRLVNPTPDPDGLFAPNVLREEGLDGRLAAAGDPPQSPIFFDRNGLAYRHVDPDLGTERFDQLNNFVGFDRGLRLRVQRQETLPRATPTQINARIMSGIVPSREHQTYGGLHNFPRFNEDWNGIDLAMAGGFFQLYFSHSSTGPYELEAWEYDTSPLTDEVLGYYEPPNRVWGYDVGLEYAQPGPISERFATLSSPRSEFYRELPLDDPYIQVLRCAPNPFADGTIDPNVENCP